MPKKTARTGRPKQVAEFETGQIAGANFLSAMKAVVSSKHIKRHKRKAA